MTNLCTCRRFVRFFNFIISIPWQFFQYVIKSKTVASENRIEKRASRNGVAGRTSSHAPDEIDTNADTGYLSRLMQPKLPPMTVLKIVLTPTIVQIVSRCHPAANLEITRTTHQLPIMNRPMMVTIPCLVCPWKPCINCICSHDFFQYFFPCLVNFISKSFTND